MGDRRLDHPGGAMATEQPVTPLGVRLLYAQAALLDGDLGVATTAFSQLVADAPALHQARYGLASCLMAAGDQEGGTRALDTARILHADEILRAAQVDTFLCRADSGH